MCKETVLEALDNEHLLTAWEWDFVNNLANKPEGYDFTSKQREVLTRIQDKLDKE